MLSFSLHRIRRDEVWPVVLEMMKPDGGGSDTCRGGTVVNID